jgi:hypothetical protein
METGAVSSTWARRALAVAVVVAAAEMSVTRFKRASAIVGTHADIVTMVTLLVRPLAVAEVAMTGEPVAATLGALLLK